MLVRHGQSEWNLSNRFTGWVDVDLTPQGEDEATNAGRLLRDEGLEPDVVLTSLQTRAVRTTELLLHALGCDDLVPTRAWQLNERHYGALQGQDKKEAVAEFGEDQVKLWRRSYSVPPPEHDRRPNGSRSTTIPAYRDLPDRPAPEVRVPRGRRRAPHARTGATRSSRS